FRNSVWQAGCSYFGGSGDAACAQSDRRSLADFLVWRAVGRQNATVHQAGPSSQAVEAARRVEVQSSKFKVRSKGEANLGLTSHFELRSSNLLTRRRGGRHGDRLPRSGHGLLLDARLRPVAHSAGENLL